MRLPCLALVCLPLVLCSVTRAAVTSFWLDYVPQQVLPGHWTYDLKVSGTGQFTGVQMIVDALQGGIYQHPFGGNTAPNSLLFPFAPEVEFDTFVTGGGLTQQTAVAPIIVGGAANLGGQSGFGYAFSDSKIDITWAPPGASPVHNPNFYTVGRFTFLPRTLAVVRLLGLTFQEPNYIAPEFLVDSLRPFRSDPRDGSELDFGFGAHARTLELATRAPVTGPGSPMNFR